MNRSKVNEVRFWRKWYTSGSVRQPALSKEDLLVSAVVKHFSGPGAGYSVLSLGEKTVNSGSGWKVTSPTNYMAVLSHNFSPGEQLKKRPAGAIPCHLLFDK